MLICHALSGDAHVADGPGADGRREARLVGRDGRAGQGHRHAQVLRDLQQRARRAARARPVRARSTRRPASPTGCAFPLVTVEDMVDVAGRAARPTRRRAAACGGRAARWAACRRSRGRQRYPERVRVVSSAIATTPRLGAQAIAFNEVGRTAILGDPDFRGRRLLRRRAARARAGDRADGRPHHLPVRRVDAREVRAPAARPRGARLRLRDRVRGRELPRVPGQASSSSASTRTRTST